MDLSKIRAFITVAEELNFTRAARELGMSQPPLTRLIRGFEGELGVKLLERTTRQVRLTAAGVHLLQEGRALLTKSVELEKQLRAIGKLRTGSLTVGFSMTAFLASFPKILSEFQERFPKIKVDVVQDHGSGLLKRLRDGRADICFVEGAVDAANLISLPITDEILGLSVPKGHALAKRKSVSFSDLKKETIILHPKGEARGFHGTIEKLFKDHGVTPKVYIKEAQESCPILVATGRGISLTVASSPMFENLQNVFVPLKNSFVPISVFYEDSNPNPSLKVFASFARESAILREHKAECLLVLGGQTTKF